MEPSQPPPGRRKLQRITQACDFCHRRGLKCVPPANEPVRLTGTNTGTAAVSAACLTCVGYGQACTRLRQPKKRGKKPQQRRADTAATAHWRPTLAGSAMRRADDALPPPQTAAVSPDSPESPGSSFAASAAATVHEPCTSRAMLSPLIDIYLDSIYPLFPFFCETKLLLWWKSSAPELHDTYYSSVVCMCALSAWQADKDALFTRELAGGGRPRRSLAGELLQEAIRLTPADYGRRDGDGDGKDSRGASSGSSGSSSHGHGHGDGDVNGDVNLLCCYGILALVGMQTGDAALLHRYLGLFHGLSALMGFHNEERWPGGLTRCERETRRRMFWVVYRVEVHNACVLGHPIRTPEAQTFVQYPCGVHHPATLSRLFPDRNGRFENWFAGWNYTTELYRILEHAIVHFRRKRTAHSSVLWRTDAATADSTSDAVASSPSALILQRLRDLQSSLMPQFAQAALKSSDSGSNRCGFQVANILCTIHLVKMVVLASEKGGFSDVCQTVQDLVYSMGTVPRDYIRAFGTPLMQELRGVGFMLTSITGRDHSLSEAEHLRLKSVVLFLAAFMETLADCIESAAHAAFCLRASLSRIDEALARRVEHDSPPQTRPPASPSAHSEPGGAGLVFCELGVDFLAYELDGM